MSTIAALTHETDDAPRPVSADIVSAYLATRRVQRQLTIVAACIAALVLAATIAHGYHVMRPLPDIVTFAFRV